MILLATALSVAASTEALIILSNLILALATFLLFWASMREQHATIKTITQANSRLLRRIFTTKKPNDSD